MALNIGWYSSQLVAPILSFHPEAQDYPHGSSQSGAVNLHWSFSKAQCVFKSYHFHFVVWCNSWIGPQSNTSSSSDVHWECCSVMPAITKTDGGFVLSFGLLAFDLQVHLLSLQWPKVTSAICYHTSEAVQEFISQSHYQGVLTWRNGILYNSVDEVVQKCLYWHWRFRMQRWPMPQCIPHPFFFFFFFT